MGYPHKIQGSLPGVLSWFDWKKIGTGAVMAIGAAVVAYYTTEILPVLKDNGELGLAIAALLSIAANVVRKWWSNTQVATLVALLFIFAMPMAAGAEVVALDTGNDAGKTYWEVENGPGGKVVGVTQIRKVASVPSNPTDPTDPVDPPPPPPPSTVEAAAEKLTRETLSKGGTKTSGVAISAVYSFVAGAVKDGDVPPDAVMTALKGATNAVLEKQPDRDAWVEWRLSVGASLTKLSNDGFLPTKEAWATTLRQISDGMNRATGWTGPLTLSEANAKLGEARADGILDGLNIQKIIELIKIILKFLELFGGGDGGGVVNADLFVEQYADRTAAAFKPRHFDLWGKHYVTRQ